MEQLCPAGRDRRMEGCSTTKSLISWLGKPSLGNTGATEIARVGQGSGDGAEQAAANEKQAESPASPPRSPLTSRGQLVFS